MAIYINKDSREEVEAVTFDELLEYGLNHSTNIVDGVPLDFKYKGFPVTHEDKKNYIISDNVCYKRINRNKMLVIINDQLVITIPNISFERGFSKK